MNKVCTAGEIKISKICSLFPRTENLQQIAPKDDQRFQRTLKISKWKGQFYEELEILELFTQVKRWQWEGVGRRVSHCITVSVCPGGNEVILLSKNQHDSLQPSNSES